MTFITLPPTEDWPATNTSLHFGDSMHADVTFHFHRDKPFTRFQVWMIKRCFGWHAENHE